MPLIPTKRELGPLDQLAQRPSFTPSVDKSGMAMEAVGEGLQKVATAAQAISEDRLRTEAFNTSQGIQRLDLDADAAMPDIQSKVPVDGAGLQKASLEMYDQKSAELYRSTPEPLRERVGQILETQRKQFEVKAGALERGQRSTFFRTGISDSVQRNIEAVFNDPTATEKSRANILADIGVADLPLDEKATLTREALTSVGKAKFARLMQDDPEAAARSLGVVLQSVGGAATSSGSKLLDAVIHTESSGNPTAISNKGATGLAGVMPGTGKEIAGDIGDANYPVNGSTAEQQAYLQDPTVSKVYGAHYLDKMLTRYGGDKQAALIAYNGGAERADKWLAAGRDDSVIPKESADYYKKVLGTSGTASGENFPIIGRDGKPADMSGVQPIVIDRFTALQNQWGSALLINSGHRDIRHNAAVGGAKGSQHISGNALDIDVSNMSKDERLHLISMASAMGFKGIGVYSTAIHLDMGPKRAWGPTYHDDSVPGWAKGAIDAHLAGKHDDADSGLAAPGVHLDPDLSAIPFTERLDMANKAQQAAAKRAAQQRTLADAQYSTYKGQYDLGIVQNQVSEEKILTDPVLKESDQASLIRSLRAQKKESSSVEADFRSYLDGGLTDMNPLDTEDTGRVDKVYKMMQTQLVDQPPEVQQREAARLIKRSGIIPQSVEADLRRGSLSTDPAALSSNMDRAAFIQRSAPDAFTKLPTDFRKDFAEFQTLTQQQGMSSEAAAKKMIDGRAAKGDLENAYGKDADKAVKDLSLTDVTAAFDPGMFSFEPGAGAMPRTQAALFGEYQNAFRDEFLASGGNAGVAKSRALEKLKETWGISTISGTAQITKLPPEKFLPPRGGGYDYLREDALAVAREAAGEVQGEKPAGKPVPPAIGKPDSATLRPLNSDEYRDNGDGSFSTEVTATIQDAKGKWVNVPSLWMSDKGWVDLGEDEDAIGTAMAAYEAKGKPFPRFNTVDEAEKAAVARSKSGGIANGALAGSDGKPVSNVTNVTLLADGDTAVDINAKRSPSYQLWYETKVDGQSVYQRAPARWAMTPDKLKELGAADTSAAAQTFREHDDVISQKRINRDTADQAADKASTETVGPDWMKARAAEIARERSLMDAPQTVPRPAPVQSETSITPANLGIGDLPASAEGASIPKTRARQSAPTTVKPPTAGRGVRKAN